MQILILNLQNLLDNSVKEVYSLDISYRKEAVAMFANNLQNIFDVAAPEVLGASFDAIISICVVVIVLSVLVIKPLAGGVK